MTLDAWSVAVEIVVAMDTTMPVEGTTSERNCMAWPAVSNRKSTERQGMALSGSRQV